MTGPQKRILELMADGWELGVHTTIEGWRPWLQQGGLGRGGAAQYGIREDTIMILKRQGYIERCGDGPGLSERYRLTELGQRETRATAEEQRTS